jgi:hypothetical protein
MPRDVSLLDQNARAFNAQVAAIVVGDAIAVGDFPISLTPRVSMTVRAVERAR